jgi:hypothetical protein
MIFASITTQVLTDIIIYSEHVAHHGLQLYINNKAASILVYSSTNEYLKTIERLLVFLT